MPEYGKLRVREDPYSGIFYAVLIKISQPEITVNRWITLIAILKMFVKLSEEHS